MRYMKRIIEHVVIAVLAIGFLVSCSESRKRATDRLNEINNQAEEFNSQLDDRLKQVESIDSVVRSGAEQIKQYDSLLQKNTSTIDSIAKKKAKAWEELTSF